jgi:hypothetical protein
MMSVSYTVASHTLSTFNLDKRADYDALAMPRLFEAIRPDVVTRASVNLLPHRNSSAA